MEVCEWTVRRLRTPIEINFLPKSGSGETGLLFCMLAIGYIWCRVTRVYIMPVGLGQAFKSPPTHTHTHPHPTPPLCSPYFQISSRSTLCARAS